MRVSLTLVFNIFALPEHGEPTLRPRSTTSFDRPSHRTRERELLFEVAKWREYSLRTTCSRYPSVGLVLNPQEYRSLRRPLTRPTTH
jgi:hypothetical protein